MDYTNKTLIRRGIPEPKLPRLGEIAPSFQDIHDPKEYVERRNEVYLLLTKRTDECGLLHVN